MLVQIPTFGKSPAFRKVLDKKGISLPFLFSHLILRVNCTFNYRPLKGLITGNLNLSLEMVMQMKMALPLKKFTGFQHWGIAGGGDCVGYLEKSSWSAGEAASGTSSPPAREVSRPAGGSAWASPPSLLYSIFEAANCCAQPCGLAAEAAQVACSPRGLRRSHGSNWLLASLT